MSWQLDMLHKGNISECVLFNYFIVLLIFYLLRDKAGSGPVRASLFLTAISGAAVPLSAEVQRQERL